MIVEDCVYGAAYEVSKEDEGSVKQALDEREKDGYTVIETNFYFNDENIGENICFTYTAHTSNSFWAGEAPLEQMAEQIARAHGPSGSNREYLFRLADAIRAITSVNDEHLFTLERLVKEILSKDQ